MARIGVEAQKVVAFEPGGARTVYINRGRSSAGADHCLDIDVDTAFSRKPDHSFAKS